MIRSTVPTETWIGMCSRHKWSRKLSLSGRASFVLSQYVTCVHPLCPSRKRISKEVGRDPWVWLSVRLQHPTVRLPTPGEGWVDVFESTQPSPAVGSRTVGCCTFLGGGFLAGGEAALLCDVPDSLNWINSPSLRADTACLFAHLTGSDASCQWQVPTTTKRAAPMPDRCHARVFTGWV